MNIKRLKEIKEELKKAPKFWKFSCGRWIRTYDADIVDRLLNEVIDAILEEEILEERSAFMDVMKLAKERLEEKDILKEYIVEYSQTFYFQGFNDPAPTSHSSGTILTFQEKIMARDLKDAYRIAKEKFQNIVSIVGV